MKQLQKEIFNNTKCHFLKESNTLTNGLAMKQHKRDILKNTRRPLYIALSVRMYVRMYVCVYVYILDLMSSPPQVSDEEIVQVLHKYIS